MTTNISLRVPIDLIASADKKLAKRGQPVRSMNELIRVVLLEFCSTEGELDEFTAYKHYERRFRKVRQSQDAELVRELAKEVRNRQAEE